ncbi:hypothetical protein BGX38DRAFT_1252011 [Terfezia claveryi]|nr:hypothetical protein BGX38DRAFT_1252011 [Terfezia claveryi]
MGLMSLKRATYSRNRNSGLYRNSKMETIKTLAKCKNGVATTPNGDIFRCKNIDLCYWRGSSIWGWTAPDGREFAAIGQADGAAFVEVDGKTGHWFIWRLPQPKDNYAVIGSEARAMGFRSLICRKMLPTGATHNIVTTLTGLCRCCGCPTTKLHLPAGLIFIDLKSPSKPTSPGCNAADGYVHDAQCLPYRAQIGGLLIMDDEYDEYDGTGLAKDGFPVSYIWDIQDLQKPKQTGYFSPRNYGAGLRILDISTVKRDPTGKGIREVGRNSYPEDDTEGGGGLSTLWKLVEFGLFKSGVYSVDILAKGSTSKSA